MKIQIFSDYDFFVTTTNFQQELSSFNKLELSIEQNEQAHVMFYPLNAQNSIPFCIKFCPAPTPQNNIEIYKTNCGYDVFVKPKLIYKKDYYIEKLIVGKTSHIVRVFSEHLEFECKDICKVANIAIETPEIKSINGNIVVFGKHNNKMACCIFCVKTKQINTYICEQMEISDKTIKLLVPKNSFISHLELKTLLLEADGVKISATELYSKYSDFPSPIELMPYKFMEAVFASDETLAKTYLSADLAQTPLEAFVQFFGEPEHISSPAANLLTLYQDGKAKHFEFVFENGKICEIVEKN